MRDLFVPIPTCLTFFAFHKEDKNKLKPMLTYIQGENKIELENNEVMIIIMMIIKITIYSLYLKSITMNTI